MQTHFNGDFDMLPIAAQFHLERGVAPHYPTESDFALAVTQASDVDPFSWRGAAAVWYVEAVRWRRGNGGQRLDIETIATATAAQLHKRQAEALAA